MPAQPNFGDELRHRSGAAAFSKQPRQAKTRTQQSFRSSTNANGETRKVAASIKRPGKQKWPVRLSTFTPENADPALTGRNRIDQARVLGQAHDLTPMQAAMKERFGGYGQAFQK